MWKYVAFILLIAFSPLDGASAVDTNTTTATSEAVSVTLSSLDKITTSDAAVTGSSPTTTSVTTGSPSITTSVITGSPTITLVATDSPTTTTSENTTSNSSVTTDSPPTTSEDPVTTGSPVTTSNAPPTTPLPPPTVFKYAIHAQDNENETCLRVEMALRVDISDPRIVFNFPNATIDGSYCNSTADKNQTLKLTDKEESSVLTFIFVKENKKYFVQNISFGYLSSVDVSTSGHYFSAGEGKSYLCNSETSVHVENVTLTFSSVHLQAFKADTFGLAEECDADNKVGDIVPIAVGCALAALVVIVLIAYLVGRRRSRQRGYQSV